MKQCLIIALEPKVLFTNMKMRLNKPEKRLLIGENQYLTIRKLLHSQWDGGLEISSILFFDILQYLLKLELHILTENYIIISILELLPAFLYYLSNYSSSIFYAITSGSSLVLGIESIIILRVLCCWNCYYEDDD